MNKTFLWSLIVTLAIIAGYPIFKYENRSYAGDSKINVKSSDVDNSNSYFPYDPNNRIVDKMALRAY